MLQLKKVLGRLWAEYYPDDLRTATRAEFVTLIRKIKKLPKHPKGGCWPIVLILLGFWMLVVFLYYLSFF